MRILILGAGGMLGHTLLERLSAYPEYEVFGSARRIDNLLPRFAAKVAANLRGGVDADNFDSILRVFGEVKPDVVVNCIGIIKQLPAAQDPIITIGINALLPHRLALACKATGARLVHFSTDCVFDGAKGDYREADPCTATDLYGQSKFLGELHDAHTTTLRTSIIGHELGTRFGLVEWFLAQTGRVKGYRKAIFSGFPSGEFARILHQAVLPRPELSGLYHVAAAPISKYDLLSLIASQYAKAIAIDADDAVVIDRSLNAERFEQATGYRPPSWPELIEQMHSDYARSARLGS